MNWIILFVLSTEFITYKLTTMKSLKADVSSIIALRFSLFMVANLHYQLS